MFPVGSFSTVLRRMHSKIDETIRAVFSWIIFVFRSGLKFNFELTEGSTLRLFPH